MQNPETLGPPKMLLKNLWRSWFSGTTPRTAGFNPRSITGGMH